MLSNNLNSPLNFKTQLWKLNRLWWYLRGLFIGDEHFDLVEGFLGTSRGRSSSRGRFGVGGACMGAGDVDLFASTAWWFGVGKVCDEDYSFTGQHCRGRTGKHYKHAYCESVSTLIILTKYNDLLDGMSFTYMPCWMGQRGQKKMKECSRRSSSSTASCLCLHSTGQCSWEGGRPTANHETHPDSTATPSLTGTWVEDREKNVVIKKEGMQCVTGGETDWWREHLNENK